MTDWILPMATLVLGAVVSGAGTYAATRSKVRFDYDTDLRQKRNEVYADLWQRLEPLARYGRSKPYTPADRPPLAAALSQWYFHTGGLYLSTAARDTYFALQDLLARPDEPSWDEVREAGSRLRTSLTYDVGTRNQPQLKGERRNQGK